MQMPLVLTNRRRRGGSASAPAFSPSTLYSSGSQGIWLDPSDLSTMFSDRAGTTPVTAPGTVVGLRLDKSKGLVLGAELVTNGDYSSGTTGWSSSDGTISAVSGGLLVSQGAVSDFTRAIQPISCTIGATYKITGSLVSKTAANAALRVSITTTGTGAGVFAQNIGDASGEYSGYFVATAATMYVWLLINTTTNDVSATFDNISVRELPGNHAVAPTDAARPIYGVEPKGGRRNLLTFSEQFDNAVWAKTAASIPATNGTAPDGTATADTLREDSANNTHNLLQSPSASASTAYTASVYFKREAGTRNAYIQVNNNGSGVGGACFAWFDLTGSGAASAVTDLVSGFTSTSAAISSVGSGWYRCSLRLTTVAGTTSLAITPAVYNAGRSYLGDGTSGIYLWGAQLELGSTATNYQRVTTAYDITESGVPTCHYVQYDGSDDSMSTAAIDFTATDKMSVFAGVRKLSDAAQGVLYELSADEASNNGTFVNYVPFSTSVEYSIRSRGAASANSTQRASADSDVYRSPVSNVVTGLHDIASDLTTLRINGTQAAQSTADQGTGNFGSYPLFFGRRNNATLPFNGRDFGIIIVGKAASSTEITDTETWLAAKTAQVTL